METVAVKDPLISPYSPLRLLPTVDESFEDMLAAIGKAAKTIRFEMYIYAADAIGERFREALVQACERGVRVKVLIDAWGSITLSDGFWDPLRSVGGEMRWFNPLKVDRCGIRNHRKLLVCDESIAIVGGFNISLEYQGDGVSRGWRDLGLQVQGVMARELAASFDTLFALADFQYHRFSRFRRARLPRFISTYDGQLFLIGPGRGQRYLKQALKFDLRGAKTVQIICAYFLPTRPIRLGLIHAAKRGCKVQIILAGKSDVQLSQLASRCFYHSFLEAGIEIYEYQPQILHAKLWIFDQVVYIGSANLDRRSFYINYELVLRLTHPKLIPETQALFNRDLALSHRIDSATWSKSRSFWNKLKERWAFFLLARVDPFLARRQMRNLR